MLYNGTEFMTPRGGYQVGPWGPSGSNVLVPTHKVTLEMWAQVGWYPPVFLDRQPFYTYETTWELQDGQYVEVVVGEPVLDEAAQTAAADEAIKAQIREIEALLTPRLVLEADCGEECTVNKPGCCIDGLSPVAARAQINTELKALRAQIVGDVYYQVK
jgi:hypothetical protein